MSQDNYVIAASKKWAMPMAQNLSRKVGASFHLITEPGELVAEKLKALSPKRIFLPHWSHIVPPSVHESFECVIFHMTDLPFGRGGSPLQNLISRGIAMTKMSAIRCVSGLDSGDVYMKRDLSLAGSASEIFARAETLIEEMILEMIATNPKPKPQSGESVIFKRRTPDQSDLNLIESDLKRAYDHIRMLDADEYPRAFLETANLRVLFQNAKMENGKLTATVDIELKDK